MAKEVAEPNKVVYFCASNRTLPFRPRSGLFLREGPSGASVGVEARMSDYFHMIMVASVVVVHNIMLTNYLRQIVRIHPRATFATAVTRDQVDYYSALEV